MTRGGPQAARGARPRISSPQHTDGFDAFADKARATTWDEIERVSGLTREDLEQAADVYVAAERVIGVYGMGLTQHVHGSQSIGMLVNLLLMRGNIGRPGAGISPVRGHSNVQGQRTVGISEKPELVPLDKLADMFDFEPPRDKGMTTVDACEGISRWLGEGVRRASAAISCAPFPSARRWKRRGAIRR